jgi:FkbM family methyltransferase
MKRTFAEWRTVIANRLFGGTPMLRWISAAKWAIYPALVRSAPWLAIAIHEPESTRAYWNAIEPGMLVVDGGSNMGGYALLASRRAGAAGRVFAFEPEPANFARLSARLRKHANVTPVQKAIAATSGEAVLHLDSFHAGHSLVNAAAVAGSIAVPVTSLDDFVREQALPGIDVVKLDVEGVELLALDGMRLLLGSARRPTILCEVHSPIAPEEVIGKLAPFGYRCRLLDAELNGGAHAVPVHLLALPPERAGA